jgi:ketosteroid isomerase-like protein
MQHFARFALIGAALVLVPAVAFAAPASRAAQSSGPEAAAVAFIGAFNALDRARFDPLFADDVTMFFPSAPFEVRRVEGKAAVLGWFGRFFDMARARTGKLNIQPVDLMVQNYGTVSVVTFHLNGGENVGRRTLVLRKDQTAWKIVHFHASAQPLNKPKDGSGKTN